jgi:thymidylate synthase
MRNYLDLMQKVLTHGVREPNRTGIDTLTIAGEMLKFDLEKGFPAMTTKKLFYEKGVIGELIGFLEGTSSLARFQELGCNVWDKNMTDPKWLDSPICQGPDDMGRIYGTQWRNWTGKSYLDREAGSMLTPHVDQIAVALADLRSPNPSRRIVVNAWNPAELDKAVLPPCHMLFQLLPHKSTNKLNMVMYQRSCDLFLGIPFNIASYATLLHIFAAWGGYEVGELTMMLADVHIYMDHIDQCKEQLSREPMTPCQLFISMPVDADKMPLNELIADLHPANFELFGYNHHPAIKASMAR